VRAAQQARRIQRPVVVVLAVFELRHDFQVSLLLFHTIAWYFSKIMQAVLNIDEIVALIVAQSRDTKSSLAALSSTNRLLFDHARPVLWENFPGYLPLVRLMPEWSWKHFESHKDYGRPFIVCHFYSYAPRVALIHHFF
jgi:hypothetical protein